MSKNSKKISDIVTIKDEVNVKYTGISRNEDPADYVRMKSTKAVKLA